MTTLVELCAGTASVSLWALGRRAPLAGYMGSKRRWAGLLVDALGVDQPERVVLVDAGPWGDVWTVLRDPQQRWRVAAQLDAWDGQDLDGLWDRLVIEPPPADGPAWRVAQFLWLQFVSATAMPVWWEDGWRSGAGSGLACLTRAPRFVGSCRTLALRLKHLEVLPWERITVVHADLRDLDPIPGATVYFDPPYVGCPRYAALCPREDVIRVAERWADDNCRVAVSESEPLPIPGWTSRRLARREWVTASWPIAIEEQLGLWTAA